MQPIETYKPLCALAIIVLIFGLSFLVWKWPQGKDKTFSQHAAAYRHTILYYIGLFTLVLPLLLLFFIGWFVPTFRLPVWFTIFITASALLQYSVTLIPEVGGWRTKYHRFLTFCSVALLLPTLVMVIVSGYVDGAAKAISTLALLGMIGIMCFVAVNKKHKYLLLLQAAYYAVFLSAVLGTTYWG